MVRCLRDLVDLRPEQRDLRIDVALGLELADDLARELVVAASRAPSSPSGSGVESATGSKSAMGSLRAAFCSVSPNSRAVVEAVPGLLGHRLVHDAADDLAHGQG